MELTDLSFRFLLLFFPGFVCAILFNALTEYEEKGFPWFLVRSFVLGLSSYLVLAAVGWIVSLVSDTRGFSVGFFDTVTYGEPTIDWVEILAATGVAILLALGLSAAFTYKILHRIARRVRITRQSGELDIWAHTFNSPDVEWVVVRDRDSGLIYEGWVGGFSNSSTKPELLLKDVRVYRNDTGEELYRVPAIYFAWETRDLEVQIRVEGYYSDEASTQEDGHE